MDVNMIHGTVGAYLKEYNEWILFYNKYFWTGFTGSSGLFFLFQAFLFGHRPKRQKHVSALIVAVVIPPRRDLNTTNQPG